MTNKIPTDRDIATQAATAFASWDDLMHSVKLHDYVPTLNRGSALQSALGALLEAADVRVFWVGKAGRHAA